jgi:hypothetical protein
MNSTLVFDVESEVRVRGSVHLRRNSHERYANGSNVTGAVTGFGLAIPASRKSLLSHLAPQFGNGHLGKVYFWGCCCVLHQFQRERAPKLGGGEGV